MSEEKKFTFELSLSVLNHLGRNLYRNFITVLGEAISNSWDADATDVWISIDHAKDRFSIVDNGTGMSSDDFQNRFLRIGYSKRKSGARETVRGRPYIGAKGIGKLALLSCAQRITVLSKTKDSDYVGGTIDNQGLDEAIKEDLTPQQYPLEAVNDALLENLKKDHPHGTIIVFEKLNQQLKSSLAHIRKLLAMSFRFSVVDPEFRIHVNGKELSIEDVRTLVDRTQFLWTINQYSDGFTKSFKPLLPEVPKVSKLAISGFLATVSKPRDLKIDGTDERASVDLFVNGRLREKNILRHIPTQRIVESYLYGQIFFDQIDRPDNDPFTSSREGIVEGDAYFAGLLLYLKETLIPQIISEWDAMRLKVREEGDDEEDRVSKRDRQARNLVDTSTKDFLPTGSPEDVEQTEKWLNELREDAEFNVSAYVDCFLSENLVRRFLEDKGIGSGKHTGLAQDHISNEKKFLEDAGIFFVTTKKKTEIYYLGMAELGELAEGARSSGGDLTPLMKNWKVYRPLRNSVGHTSLLTGDAKSALNLSLANTKGRIRSLLSKS